MKIDRCYCVILLIGGCLLFPGPTQAQRPAQGPMSETQFTAAGLGYELFWEDNFESDQLDTNKWEIRGVGPRGLAYVSPEAVEVRDGCLRLRAFKQEGRVLLGAVGTQGKLMTRYGFFECRAELQKSAWIWAAFWIQSPNISKGEDPAIYGAEIDIMEFFKKLGPDIVSHNVHWAYGPNQKTTRGMQSHRPGVSEGFHTFALEWTPDQYTFFVDGYKYYEVRMGVSRIEQYLILSMEAPSDEKELARAVFPDVFKVDWVRVYKRKGENPGPAR